MHLLVVDLHVRDFDFVGELRALLLRDHVEEVVAQPWYNTFVLAASHHRVRFPGPFEQKEIRSPINFDSRLLIAFIFLGFFNAP